MNFCYAAQWQDIKELWPGIFRKIEAQCNEISKAGFKVDKINLVRASKFVRTFPFTTASFIWSKMKLPRKIDVLYIRNALIDYQLIRTLKYLKYRDNSIIIIEIPTYPYDGEYKIKQLPLIIKDRIFRKHLHKYVDRIVTYSTDKMIFGIPTINTVNGIEVDSIVKKRPCIVMDEIHLISVASLAKWHGYDRFLLGMANYYKRGGKRKIIYHCVGDGAVLEEYRKFVEENGLQEYVCFHGWKTGQELDSIYDQCTLGIEVLGCHRKGVKLSSTLKSREYWAKGLPFITECEFPSEVEEINQYIMKVPYDESPIDVEKIIEFHDNLYLNSGKTQEEIINEIRDFAYRTCDMSVAMKPIIDYIKSDER